MWLGWGPDIVFKKPAGLFLNLKIPVTERLKSTLLLHPLSPALRTPTDLQVMREGSALPGVCVQMIQSVFAGRVGVWTSAQVCS